MRKGALDKGMTTIGAAVCTEVLIISAVIGIDPPSLAEQELPIASGDRDEGFLPFVLPPYHVFDPLAFCLTRDAACSLASSVVGLLLPSLLLLRTSSS